VDVHSVEIVKGVPATELLSDFQRGITVLTT
jgi:hypothetical protein